MIVITVVMAAQYVEVGINYNSLIRFTDFWLLQWCLVNAKKKQKQHPPPISLNVKVMHVQELQ